MQLSRLVGRGTEICDLRSSKVYNQHYYQLTHETTMPKSAITKEKPVIEFLKL